MKTSQLGRAIETGEIIAGDPGTSKKPGTLMIRKKSTVFRRAQQGFVTIAAMAITAILVAIGAGYMQWASYEAQQGQHTVAAMQAYYVAQAGIVEKGLAWMRQQMAGTLPTSVTLSGDDLVIDGVVYGTYEDIKIERMVGSQDGTNFFNTSTYRISSIGKVDMNWWDASGNPEQHEEDNKVRRKAVLYIQARSFADYMYLSDSEKTSLGEIIRFFNGDTLWGRTHSNDTIHIMQSPVFYDIVSTSASLFGRGSAYNPQFLGPEPFFRAPEVEIPWIASTVRDGATHFYNEPNTEYLADFRGSTLKLWYWEEGTPFDSLVAQNTDIPGNNSYEGVTVFIDGPMAMKGIVAGAWTIGCSEDIYLIDDIRYTCLDMSTFSVPAACSDILGIVAEGDVIIANTWENGRENRAQGADIIINAAIVALGDSTSGVLSGSFTFDQQNDTWEPYICDCNPDERGQIHLTGSVTQRRRGYVHRSNNGGTGYLKDYKYDNRFRIRRPPSFLDAVDASGRALFNIVQWGQAVEDPRDVTGRPSARVLYN